jgi:trimethylamine--corrinoid protein Co-methyltransferase
MQLLDEEKMDALHRTSIRILSELGIRVMGERVMAIFEAAGAIIDRAEQLIRIDESLVNEALKSVPSSFTLTGRNPAKELLLGDGAIAFGLVAGPPNVHDRINGRRPGNLPDYENFIRLAHHFNAIHIIGNQVVAPMELAANSRHLDTYRANVTLSDLSFHCTAIGRGRAMDGINMMAIARGMTVDEMRASPGSPRSSPSTRRGCSTMPWPTG